MSIRRLGPDDHEEISWVLLHPVIAQAVEEASPMAATPELVALCAHHVNFHVFGFGEPAWGVCMFIPMNNATMDFHLYALPEARGKDTITPAKEAISAVVKAVPKLRKLTTTLSRTHVGPLRHAKKLGFKVEGVSQKSLWVNSALVDRVFLGMEVG